MPQVSSKIIAQVLQMVAVFLEPAHHSSTQMKTRCNHLTCWEQVSLPRLESQGSALEGKGLVRTCMCPLEDLLPSAKVAGPASAFSFFIFKTRTLLMATK